MAVSLLRQPTRGPVRRRGARGQALVEAAFCIPVLLALLFLAVNVSLVMRGSTMAKQAASEGARFYATGFDGDDDIEFYAKASADLPDTATVSVDRDPDGSGLARNYTMRVKQTDSDGGTWKTASARTERETAKVTVKVPVTLIGFRDPIYVEASHVGIYYHDETTR